MRQDPLNSQATHMADVPEGTGTAPMIKAVRSQQYKLSSDLQHKPKLPSIFQSRKKKSLAESHKKTPLVYPRRWEHPGDMRVVKEKPSWLMERNAAERHGKAALQTVPQSFALAKQGLRQGNKRQLAEPLRI